ncbi:hypothetical protein BDZ97DRAFT_446401 [Flammula alnicola]|nr:hypothetical protein BDZ97DRAFT_446401 [Flammula alnicola]
MSANSLPATPYHIRLAADHLRPSCISCPWLETKASASRSWLNNPSLNPSHHCGRGARPQPTMSPLRKPRGTPEMHDK